MNILEIPLTSYSENLPGRGSGNLFPQWMRAVSSVRRLTSAGATMTEFPILSSKRSLMLRNQFLIFSAWRNNTGLTELLSFKVKEALARGWAYVLGYFHPCEILSPLSGKTNLGYLRNLRSALKTIMAVSDQLDVIPVTLSEFGEAYTSLSLRA
jgi:hypothetical protein